MDDTASTKLAVSAASLSLEEGLEGSLEEGATGYSSSTTSVVVTLSNISSNTALNGKRAHVTAYLVDKGRYVVCLDQPDTAAAGSAPKPMLLLPSKLVLPVGCVVTLHGLTKLEYNGLRAEIVAPEVEGKPDRCGVKLLTGQCPCICVT